MKTYNFKKVIPKSRKIQLSLPEDAPLGKADLVLVVSSAKETSKERGITAEKLLKSKLIGIWKNRKDITDSVEYARELRRKAESRD